MSPPLGWREATEGSEAPRLHHGFFATAVAARVQRRLLAECREACEGVAQGATASRICARLLAQGRVLCLWVGAARTNATAVGLLVTWRRWETLTNPRFTDALFSGA